MNIAVAPHMPIIATGGYGNNEFENLSLFDLPTGVSLYVPEKWCEFLSECPEIAKDYDLFSWLLGLPVQEVIPTRKADYIKLGPDMLAGCGDSDRWTARQQLYAVFLLQDAKRIYAGIVSPVDEFTVSCDNEYETFINYNPCAALTLRTMIESYAPKLNQLKHYHEGRQNGDREVSPFSAYDKHDDDYARQLLQRAYEEYPGDVTDNTYLYTYDTKFKTFVEFRPNRNREYHGMDISRDVARTKCPYIVRLYHKWEYIP